MTWTQKDIDVCKEALFLLRQDVDMPTVAQAGTNFSLEWEKCKLAFPGAKAEVLSAHDWTFARGVEVEVALSAWPEDVLNCLVYVLARRLSVPIAGRLADMQTYDALYQDSLLRAKLKDLTTEFENDNDPVLSELVQNFLGDARALVNAYEVYTHRAAVVKAESDKEVKETLAITTLDELAKAASVALSVAKLAAACGLDANFKQLKLQEYTAKLQEWRKNKLNKALEDSEDTILQELLTNFGDNDNGLINAFTIYTKRAAAAKNTAELEIKNAHDWSEAFDKSKTNHRAYGAFVALVAAKLAISCGLDANGVQLAMSKYETLLQRSRIADLEANFTSTDNVTREVLAAIRGPFGQDDVKLPRAMSTFFDRVSAVKEAAFNEIAALHNWQWLDESWDSQTPLSTKIAKMDALSRAALVALITQRLAIPCGLAQEMVAGFEQLYQAKLRQARVADLESTVIEEGVAKDVLSLVRGAFSGESELPRDMKSLITKIESLKELARKDILCSHDWSFAAASIQTNPAPTDYPDIVYPYHVFLPSDCLIVGSVYGNEGRLSQWKVRSREIHSKQEVRYITYVRDVTDFEDWTPKAYRAFLLHLASDLTKTIASNPKDRQYQEQLYRDALEDAKVCDARESNTPDEAWGINELAELMLYGSAKREDPLERD